VNDTYKLATFADVLYAADSDWWEFHKGADDFSGRKITCNEATAKEYGLEYVPCKQAALWGGDDYIATGGNSGFQIVNLAELHGFNKIYLLGFDFGFTNKKHWFGDHHHSINRHSNYKEWIERFEKALPYIKANVVNCTPNSNLKCFLMANLRDVL
jgi:hypothetical protein